MCLNQGYIKECAQRKKKKSRAEFKWQLSHISNGEQTNLEQKESLRNTTVQVLSLCLTIFI